MTLKVVSSSIRAGSISGMFSRLCNTVRADDSQVLQCLRIVNNCFAFGLALVCAGCSRECDPTELCPEMDEVIGCCHKKGWDVYEVDQDEGESNEWHGVELGPGDEIVIKERRLKDISALRNGLKARHAWWQSKYGKNGDGEVGCIGLRISGSSVGGSPRLQGFGDTILSVAPMKRRVVRKSCRSICLVREEHIGSDRF